MSPLGATGSQSCSSATPKEGFGLLLFRWPGSHGPVKTAGYVPICLINAASYQVLQKSCGRKPVGLLTEIDHNDFVERDTAECNQLLCFLVSGFVFRREVEMYTVDTLVARSDCF